MAARWLPNYDHFFFSLARLIEHSEQQLSSSRFCDTSEFTVRRLDEYERTLSTLLARFRESYGHLDSQQQCITDLTHLLHRTTYLRSHFQRLCFLHWDESLQDNEERLVSFEHSDTPGRPRLGVSREQLEALQRDCGFRWNDIARMLGVSDRTLRRRRHEFGMGVEGREFSNVPDNVLDDVVRQVLEVTPAAGLRMVQGSLRQHGWLVQRIRVLHSLRRVQILLHPL